MEYGYIRYIDNCADNRDISYKNQRRKLEALGLTDIYIDAIQKSKSTDLAALLAILKPGDTLHVSKLSRLASNISELLNIITHCNESKITLNIIDLGIITGPETVINITKLLDLLSDLEHDITYENDVLVI